MNLHELLAQQVATLNETVHIMRERTVSCEDWIEDVFIDLFNALEDDLSRPSDSPFRPLTPTEQCVIEKAYSFLRDAWLVELEDDLRTHILSQVELIGGYPHDPEVARAYLKRTAL